MEGLWEPHARVDEDLAVEELLALAGRLLHQYRRQDGGCVAEGGRQSLSWSWNPELLAARVLVGEGGPFSELYAAGEKAQVSC